MTGAYSSHVAYVVIIRTWQDRVNGNSYFAGDAVNVATGEVAPIRYQYGHGIGAYVHAADNTVGDWWIRETYEKSPGSVLVFVSRAARKRDAVGGGS